MEFVATLENDAFLTRGWWLSFVGYPRIDLDKYVIISNSYATEAIKLR